MRKKKFRTKFYSNLVRNFNKGQLLLSHNPKTVFFVVNERI